jgi:MFS family permease
VTPDVRRNAFLLAGGMICNSGALQLAAALSSLTLVAVTGVKGILGLGPAIFLVASALAVGPAGRASDRFGRMPVIRTAFVTGAVGCGVIAAGCAESSGVLVGLGLALIGGSGGVIQLSRAAAAEMFPPDRRARGMSLVLFGSVSGALWGPLLFGPLFAHRSVDAEGLTAPWLIGIPFMLGGLAISSLVRPDPKEISARYGTAEERAAAPGTVREILRRPGVPTAVLAVVASFAVMASVMNLAGYVAVGHGHDQGDVFTMISIHILGMYGLILVVGDVLDRFGRRRGLYAGLVIMTLSNAALVWWSGVGGMSLALFGLGLGWNLSYVAATTELVSLTAPQERGRIVGFADLLAALTAAALALLGGAVYTALGVTALAVGAAVAAGLPALWIAGVSATMARRRAESPSFSRL